MSAAPLPVSISRKLRAPLARRGASAGATAILGTPTLDASVVGQGAQDLLEAITSLASAAAAFTSQAQRVVELLGTGTRSSRGGLALLARLEAVMTADKKPMATTKPTLTQKEAAGLIGVHPRTLQRWRAADEGPEAVKLGRLVRYRRRDVERFLEDLGS